VRNNYSPSDVELNSITRRFDINRNGRITLRELKIIVNNVTEGRSFVNNNNHYELPYGRYLSPLRFNNNYERNYLSPSRIRPNSPILNNDYRSRLSPRNNRDFVDEYRPRLSPRYNKDYVYISPSRNKLSPRSPRYDRYVSPSRINPLKTNLKVSPRNEENSRNAKYFSPSRVKPTSPGRIVRTNLSPKQEYYSPKNDIYVSPFYKVSDAREN